MRKANKLAMEIRDRLHAKFKERCRMCKAKHPDVKLHLDCIVPQGDHHHRKMGWYDRMKFYLKQDAVKNLCLLCESCNSRKGSVEDKRYHQLMRQRVDEMLEMQEQSEMVSEFNPAEVPF